MYAARLLAIAGVVASAGFTSLACAQPAPSDAASSAADPAPKGTSKESKTTEYAEAVARLNSPNALERESALDVLSNDPAFSLKQIEATLRESTLTGEQRHRLLDAAKGRFLGSTRAAMGVQFSRLPIPERVVLEKTYPQFPSYKTLKEGDMIISVEGEKLRSRDAWNRLGAHIVSKDPGEKLSVIVRRGDEKLELEVELGSYRDLPGPTTMDVAKLERAWDLRSAAYKSTGAKEPIATGVPNGKWDMGMDSLADQKRLRVKMQLPTLYRPRLIAGGEPRGGEVDQEEIWNALNNGRVNAIDQRAMRNMMQAGWGGGQQDFGSQVTMTIQQEINGLEQYRDQIKASMQRDELPAAAGGGRPKNQGLADWEAQNMDRGKMLILIEQSITALKAEAADMTAPDAPSANAPAQP